MVQTIKNQRAKLPDKGWSYFTCQQLTEAGRQEFAQHWPVELNFNYLGHYQQFENRSSLFRIEHHDMSGIVGQMLDLQPRLALMEVSAEVFGGRTHIKCTYSRKMRHREKIAEWMTAWKSLLVQAAGSISEISHQYTLSDFPTASLTSAGLENINELALRLPKGWNIDNICPCSPIQQGIFFYQVWSPDTYKVKVVYEVSSTTTNSIDLLRLQNAWERVVQKHSILRTIFKDKVSNAPLDQIVIGDYKPDVQYLLSDDSDPEAILQIVPTYRNAELQAPYQVTVRTTPDHKVYFALSISHTLMDGTSVGILARDIMLAYYDQLPETPSLAYSEYVKYIQEQSTETAMKYWESYLRAVNSTYFPCLNDGIASLQQNQ